MRIHTIDPRYGNNFIDANFFDRTFGTEDAAVNEILRLCDQGSEFTLLLPYSVKAEIAHPNTPGEVKRQAAQFAYSLEVKLSEGELSTHDRVRDLIRGNARPGQHDRDAFHLVESAKYGGRYFITHDGRLLKKANEIGEILRPLRVVKPSEFLSAYLAHAPKQAR